jgi:hypothetical protein
MIKNMKKVVLVFSLLVSTIGFSQDYSGYNGYLTVEDNVWVMNWSDQSNMGIRNELHMNGIHVYSQISNALVLTSKDQVESFYNDLEMLKSNKSNITIERENYKIVSDKKSLVIVNNSGDTMVGIKKYLKLKDIKESINYML